MPGDKPFDLPPFTGAWGFVINNVGIYGFVPCCSLWQGTQKSCCQTFNRSQAPPGEQPRSSSVTQAPLPLKIRGCFWVTSLCLLVMCSTAILCSG